MKNHYTRTGLGPDADAARIDAALDEVVGDDERHEDIEAARSVLGDPERAVHYRRTHLHYRAMAEALDALDDPIAIDSHRWRERLIEFLPDRPAPRPGPDGGVSPRTAAARAPGTPPP